MLIYGLYILACFFAPIDSKDEKLNNRYRLIISCVFLFIMMAFRDVSVGDDTIGYYRDYLKLGVIRSCINLIRWGFMGMKKYKGSKKGNK